MERQVAPVASLSAPPLRRSYPLGGAVTGPAWVAAWNLLAGHLSVGPGHEPWLSRKELLVNMIVAGDCTGKTADDLLAEGVKAGVLERKLHVIDGQARPCYGYRISPAWLTKRRPPAAH